MITPVTLFVTIILCCAIIGVSRDKVIPIYVIGMCFVPADQAIVIAGLDFKVLRIFALVGCLRIALKSEKGRFKFNQMDWLFMGWVLIGTLAYLALWGTMQAFIYKLGMLIDTFLLYYVFRVYLREFNDIKRAMLTLVASMIVLTPLIMIEHIAGVNPFSIMGRDVISIREGRTRCSGAFSHAILLGSFAASIVPISIALLKSNLSKKRSNKNFYILGVICSIYVTIASASSGPILALAAGLLSVLAFRYRKYTGKITYGLIILAVLLHMVMKAPVWHLISRIDLTGGSTGYHRFYLIDQTIKNFGEWALIGVKGVEHWGVWYGDVTSMYIAQGVNGGIVTMILFIWMIVLCMRVSWKYSMLKMDKGKQWIIWGFFCSFLTHSASFLSVAYFGQINMLLTLSFVIGALLISNTKAIKMGKNDKSNQSYEISAT